MNFTVWGLSGTLATEHDHQRDFAEERLWYWLGRIDNACNRFRDDSEISRLNARAGDTVTVSETFECALLAALASLDATDGLCDPTVLPALVALGYDVDYDELRRRGDTALLEPRTSPGRHGIVLDVRNHSVTLAPGCQLDLGASAKALAADLIARDVGESGGVVVEVGGDVAVRGRGPEGPWAIAVAEGLVITGHEPKVAIDSGGFATSSTTTRTWRAGDRLVNHVVDPRSGRCADGLYVTATVSASSCVIANAFATAALLWGEEAPYHVAQAGWSARLVRRDGAVDLVGGWPADVVNP